jgi:hypothetical protein
MDRFGAWRKEKLLAVDLVRRDRVKAWISA